MRGELVHRWRRDPHGNEPQGFLAFSLWVLHIRGEGEQASGVFRIPEAEGIMNQTLQHEGRPRALI